VKDYWYIDHEDPATRGMLTVENGKLMWPAPMPPPPAPTKKDEKSAEPEVIDYRAPYVQGAKQASYLAGSILAVGCISPDPAFSSMFTTFALSNIIGVQVVLGVTHALHSPLMAVSLCHSYDIMNVLTKLKSLGFTLVITGDQCYFWHNSTRRIACPCS
jgi:NAD(P) transhydrogenase